MKYLSILPVAVFAIALQAQSQGSSGANTAGSAAATMDSHAGRASASAAEATDVTAELTKKVDTKNAKVGDQVEAKTTSSAKLADGTKLPKGTRLLGKVTEVHARSNADKSSHLAFSFDRAVLHDGRELPVHAILTSLRQPAGVAASTADDMSMQSPASRASMGPGAAGGGGGGVLGGVDRTTSGAIGGTANTVGNVGGAVRSDAGAAGSVVRDPSALDTNATNISERERLVVPLDHATNMPGVTLSSATSSNSSGSLDAVSKNISLDAGIQMTLNIFTAQK
jgi:hypothetical protein